METSLAGLASQLDRLERAGFAGMRIKPFRHADAVLHMQACKGKQGTCYNTGRMARYLGVAMAALDDDHHLLWAGEEIPVCEKSARLYGMGVYRERIFCTEPEPGLMEKLLNEPELFDCDTFEASLEKLYTMVQGKEPPEKFTDLFYPGPFKLLVLEDGTILHRGRVNKVPAGKAGALMKREGLFAVDGAVEGTFKSYAKLYLEEGPRCLLGKTDHPVLAGHARDPDFSAMGGLTRELRHRILHAIAQDKDYFMLTGSNKEEQFGCCPSDEVTQADRLVRAGILSASREPVAPGSCPVTLYAFGNEMGFENGNLIFTRDLNLRQEVLSRLRDNPLRIIKLAARWVLLVFVAATLVLTVYRLWGPSTPLINHGLYEQLNVSRPGATVLVLFHYSQRCAQCLAMETYATELLEEGYAGMVQQKKLQFRQVLMDLPENRGLIERFGLVTSALVIVNFEAMEEVNNRVLTQSWELYDDEAAFKEMLAAALDQMMGAGR